MWKDRDKWIVVFLIYAATLEQTFPKYYLLGWELGLESLKLMMETDWRVHTSSNQWN